MSKPLTAHNLWARPNKPEVTVLLVTFFVLLVSCWGTITHAPGDPNLFLFQAQAFLDGRLDVGLPFYDTAHFEGLFFSPFPPFPAIVLTPLVALFGVEVNVVLVSVILSLFSLWVFWGILKKLDIKQELALWGGVALLFGTGYWTAVWSSWGVWYFAHVVATLCFLLTMNEVLGQKRGWLVGIFLGCAFLTRQLAVYHFIFLALVLWRERGWKETVGMTAVFSTFALTYLAFSWARFGNPLDTGYAYIPLRGHLDARVATYGLFHWRYVPANAIYMFLQGFHIDFRPPAFLRPIDVDPFGTAITFASPFFISAFWARWDKIKLIGAWVTITLTLTHLLFYYNNGFRQWNSQRFTLDFIPLLMILALLGAEYLPKRLWQGFILWAVSLNVLVFLISG